jgi:hypothetical protein
MTKGISKASPWFGRFGYLLVSLLAILILNPAFAGIVTGTGARVIMQVLVTGILFAGLYAVHDQKKDLLRGMGFLVPALLAGWLRIPLQWPWLSIVADVLMILFLVYTCSSILRQILSERDVTVDTIKGSACVYLLIGLAFAFAFALLEGVNPGSLSMVTGSGVASERALNEFVYFSYVTLTTLGYGDITPLTGTARSLAVIEATLGQFYLAVLVARLVGMYLARRSLG